MIEQATADRLLSGPPPGARESLAEHRARLGHAPHAWSNGDVIAAIEASGLLGRGGAGFPVGRKWRAIAGRPSGRAVVVVNGAEGEPPSAKDRALMTRRPHLVVDGALLAAEAIGADEVVFYIGEEHEAAVASMRAAISERRPDAHRPMRTVLAPMGYVAGEASAAVHFINAADARPTTTPPRMSQQGVGGRPTLVQNVESLAAAALIARHGDDWWRSAGRLASRGTALVTVSGVVAHGGVREIELGTTAGEVLAASGASRDQVAAVILGGYFGTWAPVEHAWDLPLDPAAMAEAGLTFGCGIVGALGVDSCGVAATAEMIGFLARESAGQCGPCVHGLAALAEAVRRIARGVAADADLDNVERWLAMVAGRGACHHPDGAVQMLASAFTTFGDDILGHVRTGRCAVTRRRLADG